MWFLIYCMHLISNNELKNVKNVEETIRILLCKQIIHPRRNGQIIGITQHENT